jgi:hypothetical protein
MATFYLKYRDTLPVLSVTLTGTDGLPFNLTGYTVKLHISLESGTVLTRTMTVATPASGVAEYAWAAADWTAPGGLVVGVHQMEYEAVNGTARITFPNNGNDALLIVSDLGQG